MVKKKMIGIFVVMLMISSALTTIMFSEKDPVRASEEPQNPGMNLDYDWVWNQTIAFGQVIYNAEYPGDIKKGREWATAGEEYTIDEILEPAMNGLDTPCGLSEYTELPIGFLEGCNEPGWGPFSFLRPKQYSSKIVITDYDLTLNFDGEPSLELLKSELFPMGIGNLNFLHGICTEEDLDDTFEFNDAELIPIDIHESVIEQVIDLDFYTVPCDILNEYTTILGPVVYLETNDTVPENQDCIFILNEEPSSEEKLDNLSDALGCILIEDSSKGWTFNNSSNYNFTITKLDGMDSNFSSVIEEIQNGSVFIADNTQDGETIVFLNCSDQSCCSGSDYVVYFNLESEDDVALKTFWTNILFRSCCIRCKGAIMVNYDEHTHLMMHTVRGWNWFTKTDIPFSSIYSNRFPLPIFSVNGEMLDEIQDAITVDGFITQEYRKQTEDDPGVISHNVVAYRNISRSPQDAVVVLSHRMDGWWGECPGDAGTSGAILLGIAKYMKDNDITPKYNLTFLFTTGEEYGMRGANHFVDSHKDFNYKYWIGFEQLGFHYPLDAEHNLSMTTYNPDLLPILSAIENQTNYEERMFNLWSNSFFQYNNTPVEKTKFGGAEDWVWKDICDTILIEKSDNWDGHHQVGDEYQEGDSLKYINQSDVNVTFELAWNMTKYFCVNPDCSFDDDVSYTTFDSPNDGDTLPDSIRAEFSIDSILPSDKVMVNATLCDQNDNGAVVAWKVVDYTITTLGLSHPYNITIAIPDEFAQGEYTLQLRLYNSTGRININVDPDDDEPNEIQESDSYQLYHPFGNPIPGDFYSNTEDVIRGSYFTANEYGTARNITAYVQCGNVSGPPSIHSVCMIYRKSDNKLIGRTEDTNPVTGASPDWIVYNFTEPYPVLEEDTEYVLVCWSEAPCYLYYDHIVLMSRGRYNDTTYGVPLDPIVWDGANNNLYSIYCGYRNDTNPPWVTNVSEDPHIVGFGGNVTISADVVDNESGVKNVTVNIGYPGGKAENKTMTLVSGDTYQYVFNNTWLVGQYNYSIWAVDNYNNSINRSVRSHFHVSVNASISIATLRDSYSGSQYINITDPPNPPEDYTLVDQGLTWDKYYNAITGQNILEVSTEPINYQENGVWTPINTTLNQLDPNHPGYVYGYRTGNDHGLYGAYFKSNAQSEWPVAFTYNKSDDPTIHAIRSKLVGVGYVDPQSNWAYQYLQNVQSSQGQTNDNSITFEDVFTGTDVTWSYGNTGLKEEILLSNTTKTVLQNHPPSQYGLNDASSYLVFITKLDYQNLNISNDSGMLNGNVTISDTGINLKDVLGQFKCALPLGEAYELNDQSVRQKLTYRIIHLNGNTYLLSGLKLSDLNAMTFPVVVDPTLSVNSLYNDGFISNSSTTYTTAWGATSGTIDSSSQYLTIGQKKAGFPTSTYYIYRSFVLFNTTALPSNAYLDSAILSLYKKDDYSTTDFDLTIQNGQPTYPHNPLQIGDYAKGHYSGNGGSLNTVNFVNGRNNISISEFDWINEAGITKFCLRSSRDISGTTPTGNEYVNVYSANAPSAGYVPKLIITYRNQSKIKNTGSTDIKGYLLIQVQFYNSTQGKWLLDNDTINETTPRTITSGNQLALDRDIFNGHVRASDLTHGTGTYRVYAAFMDPEGNILKTDSGIELKAWWQFNKT